MNLEKTLIYHSVVFLYLMILPVFSQSSTPCMSLNTALGQKAQSHIDMSEQIVEKLNPTCVIEDTCKFQEVDYLWAQKFIDADLMHEYISSHKLKNSSFKTPLAVLDSGFDLSQIDLLENTSGTSIQFEKNPKKGFQPTQDLANHGTAVVSLIKGKNGIGIAPHTEITIYKVTREKSPQTTMDLLFKATFDFCLKKKREYPYSTPIINWSFSGKDFEEGGLSEEENFKQNFARLNRLGCLVVASAGNHALERKMSTLTEESLDSSYLIVGSSTYTGARARQSTSAEVFAPGLNVSFIPSAQTVRKNKPDSLHNKCSENKYLNQGTSFSAPLVSGVASEVVSVLLSHQKFQLLTAAEKVALLNRILKASEFAGAINGLRAVIVALKWSESELDFNASNLSGLKKMFVENPDLMCSESLIYCAQSDLNCEKSKICQNKLRKK